MISVITPVFNAEPFLERAIQSVLIQKEVSEFLLVDDGSTDNSWNIIQSYEKFDSRIIGMRHPDKKNHGRSKSRNYGIRRASNDLIAFLDADDYYLPNRFKKDLIILEKKEVDGVYNALGVHFYDSYDGDKNIPHVLTRITEKIEPENLFEHMSPIGKKGRFSGDALTVKRQAIIGVGMFNKKLKVAEDTELWIKLALKYNLSPGEIVKPVAIRGIHGSNVFNDRAKYKLPQLIMYRSLVGWAFKNQIKESRRYLLINKYLKTLNKVSGESVFFFVGKWISLMVISPQLIFNKVYWNGLKSYIMSVSKL